MEATYPMDDAYDEPATIRIPVLPLVAVAVAIGASVYLAVIADELQQNWIGWVAAVVAFTGLLLHRRHAVQVIDDHRYEQVRAINVAMVVLLVLVLALFPLHALPIALEVAQK